MGVHGTQQHELGREAQGHEAVENSTPSCVRLTSPDAALPLHSLRNGVMQRPNLRATLRVRAEGHTGYRPRHAQRRSGCSCTFCAVASSRHTTVTTPDLSDAQSTGNSIKPLQTRSKKKNVEDHVTDRLCRGYWLEGMEGKLELFATGGPQERTPGDADGKAPARLAAGSRQRWNAATH